MQPLKLLLVFFFFMVTCTFGFPAPGADNLELRHALNAYQTAMLRHHNVHRANHSAADLAYGPNLQAEARKLADTCTWGHNTNYGGGGYGQNIEAGSSPSQLGAAISDAFYNGEMTKYHWYGADNPDYATFESYGHFTQLVWKGTKHVGCWTSNCAGGVYGAPGTRWYTVCNYWPPGNMGGEYASDVGRPLGHKTVYGNY